MTSLAKELLKQPYHVCALLIGAFLVVLPTVTIDKTHNWTSHPPTTFIPVGVGLFLLCVSIFMFAWQAYEQIRKINSNIEGGVDLSKIKEENGAISTTVNGCEIRVVYGNINDARPENTLIVLPCNEYFDDRCVDDARSALGSYINKIFDGQTADFVSLMKVECIKKFGQGKKQQKTESSKGESFGPGRCLLIINPLKRRTSIALLSTTTQRAGHGLSAQISYLLDGIRELVSCLADEQINDVAMPILGAVHGGINPPLALVGLILAIAEAARHGQGGQQLRRVTIVVYRRVPEEVGIVDPVVARRVLALVASPS